MTKVAVISGGRSPERDVSLESGANAADALRNAGYSVVSLDGDANLVENLKKEKVDAVFIALHGQYGEDGTLQGLLEFLDIPYIGSGVLASALAMNKIKTKEIFKSNNIPTPDWFVVTDAAYKAGGPDFLIQSLKRRGLKFPLMVKPACLGSTIGINKATDEHGLVKSVEEALRYDFEVMLEEFIEGQEVSVPVYGVNPPAALPVIEIIPHGEFYTYQTKYQEGMSTHVIPARIEEPLYKKIQELALRAYNALGCYSFGRIDIMINKNKELFTLEVNTIPGMTKTSLLPEAALKEGINFVKVVDDLVKWGVQRHSGQKTKSTKIIAQ